MGPTAKPEGTKPLPPQKPKEVNIAKAEIQTAEDEEEVAKPKPQSKDAAQNLFNESSEDELLPIDTKYETKKEYERNRRLSAHDRQKENENLFDSLLTVNVDLPSKPSSRKSPGGSLKSPSVKSPGKSS